jgi:hypothetical protein
MKSALGNELPHPAFAMVALRGIRIRDLLPDFSHAAALGALIFINRHTLYLVNLLKLEQKPVLCSGSKTCDGLVFGVQSSGKRKFACFLRAEPLNTLNPEPLNL